MIGIYDDRLQIQLPDTTVVLNGYKTSTLLSIVIANLIKGSTRKSKWITLDEEDDLQVCLAVDSKFVVFQFKHNFKSYLYKMPIVDFLELAKRMFETKTFDLSLLEAVTVDYMSKLVTVKDSEQKYYPLTDNQVQFLEYIMYFFVIANPKEVRGLAWMKRDGENSLCAFVNDLSITLPDETTKNRPDVYYDSASVVRLWFSLLTVL